MTEITNSTNFASGIQSFVTISATATLPSGISADGGAGTIQFDAPNTFLQHILTGSGNYTSTGVLLFDVHMEGVVGGLSTGAGYINYNIATNVGTSTTYTSGSVVSTTGLVNTYARIPCLVSDIVNGGNSSLFIVITNNMPTGGPGFTVNAVSSWVSVTYLPLGFQTT